MAVTLKSIAQHLGLSVPVVSKSLHGGSTTTGVAPETRLRVIRAARQMGYRPNLSARAARTGRFSAVALVLSTHTARSWNPPQLVRGVHDALAERDLNMVMARIDDDRLASEDYTPRILHQLLVDGLLINYRYDSPPAMDALIEAHAIPAVWTGVQREANCVFADQFAAGHEATLRLLERGHRRIGCLGNLDSRPWAVSALDRIQGYDQAMRGAGLTPWIAGSPQTPAHVREILASAEPPTALVATQASHLLPVALGTALAGLSMPGDLACVAIGADQPAGLGYEFAMMVNPHGEIGQRAVELLVRRIAGRGKAEAPVKLAFRLHEGHTLTPALA